MSEISKPINSEQVSFSGQVFEDQILEDSELAAISGGDVKAESQVYSMLMSAVDNVIKSIGEGLQSVARKG